MSSLKYIQCPNCLGRRMIANPNRTTHDDPPEIKCPLCDAQGRIPDEADDRPDPIQETAPEVERLDVVLERIEYKLDVILEYLATPQITQTIDPNI